jgi:chemotaxis protein CheX
MSNPKFDLKQQVFTILPNVMQTMLGLKAEPTGEGIAPREDRVSAIIGIGGETVNGMFYFHFPARFGEVISRRLLQHAEDDPASDQQINDAVGELCNMVAGGLKSELAEYGYDTAISPPSIIRGKSFTIESEPDLEISHFPFLCGEDVLELEVHLKLEV